MDVDLGTDLRVLAAFHSSIKRSVLIRSELSVSAYVQPVRVPHLVTCGVGRKPLDPVRVPSGQVGVPRSEGELVGWHAECLWLFGMISIILNCKFCSSCLWQLNDTTAVHLWLAAAGEVPAPRQPGRVTTSRPRSSRYPTSFSLLRNAALDLCSIASTPTSSWAHQIVTSTSMWWGRSVPNRLCYASTYTNAFNQPIV